MCFEYAGLEYRVGISLYFITMPFFHEDARQQVSMDTFLVLSGKLVIWTDQYCISPGGYVMGQFSL